MVHVVDCTGASFLLFLLCRYMVYPFSGGYLSDCLPFSLTLLGNKILRRMEDKAKYALVTGASSGMGLEFALQLADRGYGIIVVSNRHDENVMAACMIRERMGLPSDGADNRVRVIDADLTLADSAQMIYDTVRLWDIEVEVLVSNAGMLLFSTLGRTSVESLDRIVSLHCATPAKLIRLFATDMQARKKGYILVTSSATAWMQYPTISHYGASKAFLKNFTRSIWYEYRRYGVGVTTVFPGAVDTPLYRLDDSKRKLLRNLGVMMSPEDVAGRGLECMFKRRYRCVPGFFTKVIVVLCAIVPYWMILPLLKIPAVKKIFDAV